ncbi:syntaxin-13-like protein [Perkinsela sp. CCAP 1560/4]|nr:syntaxin-13-like protein [Perkinsela sp. CCAP 1560/4]|eukprot:KNH07710.1 syntaxin-13-like protein [Perkinsela sp. CCAP 1560/4]
MYSRQKEKRPITLSSAKILGAMQVSGVHQMSADDMRLEVEARTHYEKLCEVQQLETDLVELNAAFGEMNQLIAMQDEEIENTLYSADSVQTNVDSGSGRLRDARAKSVSHRKNLVLVLVLLFVILGIAGTLILIFLR